jgi:sulfotransferase family protein
MQEQITIEYDDAGVLKTIFTLPPTKSADMPTVYVFSLPKAGSVLLDNIMRELSEQIGVTYVSLMGEFFKLGLAEQDVPSTTSNVFADNGYCFGGFRAFPKTFEIPNLATRKSIFLLRDPRDMLVSHYFSMRSSHPDPGKALTTSRKALPRRDKALVMSVDEYALDLANYYARQLSRYIDVFEKHPQNFTVFRYEDVIFEKRTWVADICKALDWDVSERVRNKIADKNDVVPRSENEAKHIRQVTPGDGMRKLQPATIDKLGALFREQLSYFGYDQFGPVVKKGASLLTKSDG